MYLVNLTTEPLIDLLIFNVLQCCQKHWLTSHKLYMLNDTADYFSVHPIHVDQTDECTKH